MSDLASCACQSESLGDLAGLSIENWKEFTRRSLEIEDGPISEDDKMLHHIICALNDAIEIIEKLSHGPCPCSNVNLFTDEDNGGAFCTGKCKEVRFDTV